MANRRRKRTRQYILNTGLSLAVLVVFGVTGLQVASQTSAATANPYGSADYCRLENNATVIYGWGADPNATSLTRPSVVVNVGGKSLTVATNRAGYRDTVINKWIDLHRAGDPKPGTYGFRAAFSGLYKGTKNTITGTVLNEGAGSSVIMSINSTQFVDGDSSKPYFAGNVVPDACLAVAPAPTQPPAPSPTPTPTPTPTPAPAPAPTPATPRPTTPAPAVLPNVSNTSDAVVTSGTLAAEVKMPPGNAASVHISYGKNAALLDLASTETPVSGNEVSIMLTGLEAATTYYYHIVRNDGRGKTAASPVAKFDTLGYVISLHFVDTQNKGIAGIAATISALDKKYESDDQGNLQFTGVPAGSHTVAYTYKERRYTQLVTANPAIVSPTESSSPTVVTIDFTINVEEAVSKAPSAVEGDSNATSIIIAIVLGLIALGLVVFAFLRRRLRGNQGGYGYEEPAMPLPVYHQHTPPPSDIPILPHQSGAEHIGESLKEMVMRSMSEEARRRADDPTSTKDPK